MAPPAPDSAVSLEGLKALIQTTTSLITQLESYLHSVAVTNPAAATPASLSSQPPAPAASPVTAASDPYSLAHDSASLIRAHSTKLSLFIINKPFTPSAIQKVLRELVAGPIPAIATAVQLCDPDRYTSAARRDLAWRCYRVLHELRAFLDAIPTDGNILSDAQKNGAKGDKGSLVSTGVIWAACDDVILLKSLGLAGLLVKKVEEYRDTLKDVLDELKEWGEEVEEESDDDNDDDDNNDNDADVAGVTSDLQGTHLSAQQMIDDLMDAPRIPRNDPDRIRERLDSCLKRLRLTTLMYSAVVKRRLKPLATAKLLPAPAMATSGDPAAVADATSTVAKRLDEVLPLLKGLPHRFGDVAAAFYDLDAPAIDRAMDICFFDAFAASDMLMKPWDGSARDEFTEWAEKFQISIKKPD
ncbi:hypothetical protein Micbo1qcDRAFT_169321 [Microdochium bolleyi]|uniref:Cyclin-D1-binding protein 1-like N-terminal domain-containing protein n=1 Tax=Microdochium bolleyi TaxID=196109 RepID=A0A136IKU0_9PEZI|nr:hypothetical protein Micbo1qcDRAFT_169321 [Microdochium bolleyi]